MLFKCTECGLRWFTRRSRQKCADSHVQIRAAVERFRKAEALRHLPPRAIPRPVNRANLTGPSRRTTYGGDVDVTPMRHDTSWPFPVYSGGGGEGGGAGASGSWDSGSSDSGGGGGGGGGSD